MPTMFEQAVAHIRAGEVDKGRQILIDVLKQNPRDENGWLWMTRCVIETEQKRYCFDKVLKINPQNQYAIEGLRRLDQPVSPLRQPIVSQQPPVQKQKLGTTLLTIAIFSVGLFLVLLFLYVWWLAR
jgi:hypothetical protein